MINYLIYLVQYLQKNWLTFYKDFFFVIGLSFWRFYNIIAFVQQPKKKFFITISMSADIFICMILIYSIKSMIWVEGCFYLTSVSWLLLLCSIVCLEFRGKIVLLYKLRAVLGTFNMTWIPVCISTISILPAYNRR